ncbi:hypothetical protein WDW86_06570 [Bdellovibrionota bacterium FG-2]
MSKKRSRRTLRRQRRRLGLGVFGILSLGVLGLYFTSPSMRENQKPIVLEAPSGAAGERAPASIPQGLRAVQDQVAENNKALLEEHRAFEKDGWHQVTVEPPNPALISLDHSLLGKNEPELQVQIGSNSFNGSQLDQLRVIATKTNLRKTRFLAIDAVGRSHDSSAAELLVQLYADPALRLSDRQQILGYFHPRSGDEPSVDFLLSVVADPKAPESLKKQASFPLAVISGGDNSELMKRVPAGWRKEFSKIRETVLSGGAVAQVSENSDDQTQSD